MKIIQIIYSLSYGDGVGNDCIGLNTLLKSVGYETEIYAVYIDASLKYLNARKIKNLPCTHPEDIIIYHFSIGCDLNFWIADMKGIKVLRYHNITPAQYFKHYNQTLQNSCDYGRAALFFLSDKIDYCLPDSMYNQMELKHYGYNCKMQKLPIIIPSFEYDIKFDQDLERQIDDGKYNILFTGRIVPNKCQHDLIYIFYLYKKYFHANARLILVGTWTGMEKYYEELIKYAQDLNVQEDVIFTGHIPRQQLLTYYHSSDVFLCMSEHEGFGIPLVEAMHFHLPIVAYNSTAVPETVGEGGILFEKKDFEAIAKCLEFLRTDKKLRKDIIRKQQLQLKNFSYETSRKTFLDFINIIRRK